MRALLKLILMLTLIPQHVIGDDRVWFPGDGFVGGNATHVHDPTIIHSAGRYFCFSTSGRGFGVLRASTDLKDWQVLGPVLPAMPGWVTDLFPEHRSLWAPDILKMRGGGLRMYYSVSRRFGDNDSAIGVAECAQFDPDKPLEGWRDLGLVIASRSGIDNFNAIDPETFRDNDGREWMFFGSYWSGLYVAELDPSTGKLKNPQNPERILVARNQQDRGNALEAPAVIHHAGYYYLFNSYGLAAQGVKSTYRIGVGRAKAVTGPYLDREGRLMTDGGYTLVLGGSPPMYGPGHCDVFTEAGGRTLLAHHFYDGRQLWHGDVWGVPTLQVRELLWDEDGWPLPGRPVATLGRQTVSDIAGTWTYQTEFAEPSSLQLAADGSFTIDSPHTRGAWHIAAGRLVLKPADGDAQSLLLTEDQLYFVGRDSKGRIIRGILQETGRP